MAFDRNAFNNVSSGGVNAAKQWSYKTTDSIVLVGLNGYFDQMRFALNAGDTIFIVSNTGLYIRQVISSVNETGVTTIPWFPEKEPSSPRTVSVSLSSDQVKSMFNTPVEVLSLADLGILVIQKMVVSLEYGSAQYTGGGAINLHYSSVKSSIASDSIAAADLNAASEDTIFSADGQIPTIVTQSIVNQDVFISNGTAAFADGDSDLTLYITYYTIEL